MRKSLGKNDFLTKDVFEWQFKQSSHSKSGRLESIVWYGILHPKKS